MDALHPRLLVDRFAETFRFYDAVLPELLGATRTRGDAAGPYASWDVGEEGVLALFDRAALPPELRGAEAAGPAAMLVSRVKDVDAAFTLCTGHGATPVAEPTARPEWGPTMRTAHVRAPEGTLWELQAY